MIFASDVETRLTVITILLAPFALAALIFALVSYSLRRTRKPWLDDRDFRRPVPTTEDQKAKLQAFVKKGEPPTDTFFAPD